MIMNDMIMLLTRLCGGIRFCFMSCVVNCDIGLPFPDINHDMLHNSIKADNRG